MTQLFGYSLVFVAIEGYFQFEQAVSLFNSFFLFTVATAL